MVKVVVLIPEELFKKVVLITIGIVGVILIFGGLKII